jgi:hypothetical protein
MFFRTKTSGPRTYLQVVENRWEGGCSRQRKGKKDITDIDRLRGEGASTTCT